MENIELLQDEVTNWHLTGRFGHILNKLYRIMHEEPPLDEIVARQKTVQSAQWMIAQVREKSVA
jgi:hypothetical protein